MNDKIQANDTPTEDYLNKDIFELIDAKDIPETEKEKILNKMLETIKQRVIGRMLDQLSEAEYQELQKILDDKDDKKFDEFYQKTGINLTEIYAEESLLYKIEMVEIIKQSQNKNKEA